MFWLSGRLTKAIGVDGVMTMSLLSYTLRFLIYSKATTIWQALPAEILRGVTFASFWAGATYHVYNVSPLGLTATMLGVLNGMYGGLGQSLGSLLGGALSKQFGISKAFTYCARADAVVLGLFIIYQLVIRQQSPTNHMQSQIVKRGDTKRTLLSLFLYLSFSLSLSL